MRMMDDESPAAGAGHDARVTTAQSVAERFELHLDMEDGDEETVGDEQQDDTEQELSSKQKDKTSSRSRLLKQRRLSSSAPAKPSDLGRKAPRSSARYSLQLNDAARADLAPVNSTTCLVAPPPLVHDDDDDAANDGIDQDPVLRLTAARRASKSQGLSDDSYTAPRQSTGKFRYLKPEEIQNGRMPTYDYAVIANRTVKMPSGLCRLLGMCCCCSWLSNDPERRGFRRLCLANSPLLKEGEDEHRRIVEKLCGQGLLVDIIDGGHSKEEMNSAYFILLVRASDEVIANYVKKFRYQVWVEHGAVLDMQQDLIDRTEPPTPAERIQIVNYIIEQRANLTTDDPWIHDMFPVHDNNLTDELVSKMVRSCNLFDFDDKKVLKALRYNFGEKVAYYFAFFNFYQKAMLPLAVIGVTVQILKGVMSTETYMRLLPFWGIGVCVVWSFTFLKCWERKNAEMQFEWNDKLHVKQIEYPNKHFYGEQRVNSLTGEMETTYSSWRRLPKYLCVALFTLLQTVIMLVLVAIWLTIYEILKAKYKESHIFSTQWFLILLEGIVFGIFVDVIQWNLVVTKMGAFFTHWENYRTEEQYERALIRKLFLLDFLNYYTWFFSLAFIFVIPGFGDYLMNALNHTFFGDAMNCCFGPYVDQHGQCIICPLGPKDATCIECVGFFTFDRHHVDLSAMFLTPIVVTQSLNILLGVIGPVLEKARQERARAAADASAQQRVMEAGSMKILGSLDYDKKASNFSNKSHARYLEYTAQEIEVLNKKARAILFESEQESYDPYNDFHALTVQYGFTVMFSILWPLMPFACYMINVMKRRTDGYRLCKTLKRPIPRKANGIGAWRGIFSVFAYIAVIVNVLLICISTGSLEFFDPTCVRDIENQLEKQGKKMSDYMMGPNFGCFHISWRLLIIILLEHLLIGIAYLMMTRIPKVPNWITSIMNSREKKFKELLKDHEHDLFPGAGSRTASKTGIATKDEKVIETKRSAQPLANPRSSSMRADFGPAGQVNLRSTSSRMMGLPPARQLSVETITPISTDSWNDLEEPSSNGLRSKAREQLARKWSVDTVE
ncbi:TPA: hypothetical protein N0F65_007446 [Lagenidium giganteum]|uniref:Anoctamin transmembrane domain-containing protein n=1 Tax=Lagenidium giganteum TaxID=4803 RepID=A0AAV2ZM13_9STRA|nr:TPA: hypothetical protein N0F65_007446 [Lagenidium giganteum]